MFYAVQLATPPLGQWSQTREVHIYAQSKLYTYSSRPIARGGDVNPHSRAKQVSCFVRTRIKM
jgi:hypothetical protein